MDDADFLTTDEVARIFHVDRRTVTRWLAQNRLHGIRLPTANDRGQWRIPLAEVTRMAGPAIGRQLEQRIRDELHAAVDDLELDPGALRKIQDRTGGNST